MTGSPTSRAGTWEPSSWHRHTAAQQPDWPDAAALDAALAELGRKPPLVFAGEARTSPGVARAVSEGAGSCFTPVTAPSPSTTCRPTGSATS